MSEEMEKLIYRVKVMLGFSHMALHDKHFPEEYRTHLARAALRLGEALFEVNHIEYTVGELIDLHREDFFNDPMVPTEHRKIFDAFSKLSDDNVDEDVWNLDFLDDME